MAARRGGWRSRTAPFAPDAGMVTAEAAVVLPVLVLVGIVATAGVQVAIAQTRCLEAAAVAARLVARGEARATVDAAVRAVTPAGAQVTAATAGDRVTATVSVTLRVPVVGGVLPWFVIREQAAAPAEPAAA